MSIAASAVAAMFAIATGASASTVITGNVSGVASSSGSWSWDGTQHSELRSALENGANFGPGGTDTRDTISTIDVATPDAAGLAGVDVFVSSWWRDSQSAAYEQDIVDWFLAGGDLLLLQDDPNRDGISTLLGFETVQGTSNPTTVTGVLGNGPHGTVAPVNQVGNIGTFDNAVITLLGGEVFGTDALGNATIVGFEEGAFGPNSGRLVAMSDVDLISGLFGGADYDPLNDKGRLGLNAFSYLLASDTVAPVPLPAGLPLLVAGLGGLALLKRRQRAQAA